MTFDDHMTVFIEYRVKGHNTNGKMAISSNSTCIALHGNDGKFNKHLYVDLHPQNFSVLLSIVSYSGLCFTSISSSVLCNDLNGHNLYKTINLPLF